MSVLMMVKARNAGLYHSRPLFAPIVPAVVSAAVPEDEQQTDDNGQQRGDIIRQDDLATVHEVDDGDQRSPDRKAEARAPDAPES